jgi:hypothetical protein
MYTKYPPQYLERLLKKYPKYPNPFSGKRYGSKIPVL